MVDAASPVQDYLECFREVVRLVTSDQAVPDSLWSRIRDDWAAMTPAERWRVEQRSKELPK